MNALDRGSLVNNILGEIADCSCEVKQFNRIGDYKKLTGLADGADGGGFDEC